MDCFDFVSRNGKSIWISRDDYDDHMMQPIKRSSFDEDEYSEDLLIFGIDNKIKFQDIADIFLSSNYEI